MPGLPVCAAVVGVSITPLTLFAVVVRVALADWVPSPCEVAVRVAVSVAPPAAFDGIVTLTTTLAAAPAASGPTVGGVAVVQLLPLTLRLKVSSVFPVFVMRSV